jgi:hypothetical protein
MSDETRKGWKNWMGSHMESCIDGVRLFILASSRRRNITFNNVVRVRRMIIRRAIVM